MLLCAPSVCGEVVWYFLGGLWGDRGSILLGLRSIWCDGVAGYWYGLVLLFVKGEFFVGFHVRYSAPVGYVIAVCVRTSAAHVGDVRIFVLSVCPTCGDWDDLAALGQLWFIYFSPLCCR